MCSIAVSTLVVEWIEIARRKEQIWNVVVSTLVVEWIEIAWITSIRTSGSVSTLVVEWIEIGETVGVYLLRGSLHPRGGVD